MEKRTAWFLIIFPLAIIVSACSSKPEPLGGGGKIAYRARTDENAIQIRVYDIASGQDSLVLGDETYKFWFSWSPDQSQILFQRDFHPPNSHILLVDVTGDNLQTMLDDTNSRNWMPDFSPDGQQIAFASDRSGIFNIYVMNVDGTNLSKLTEVDSSAPRWSPDGKRIAFQVYVDDNFEIFVMNADGTNPINVTNHPASDMTPSWSPDGKQLSFSSDRDSAAEKGDVFIMNADGTEVLNLTQNSAEDNNATWSPDGNMLAFISNRDGESHLYLLDVNSRNVELLPVVASEVSSPTWSRK